MKGMIAVDIGTSSSRAVVFSLDLQEQAQANRTYDLSCPEVGAAEQDPEIIVEAVMDVAAEALSKSGLQGRDIVFISFSANQHNLIALDADKRPLTQLWTWADLRPSEAAARLRQHASPYQRTGCPIHPMYWPAKIKHFLDHLPQICKETAHIVCIKEYVLFRLNGQLVVDASVAAGTGLLDIQRLDWDQPLIEHLGMDPSWLSPVVEPTHILHGLRPEHAARMGLPQDIPLVVGGSDGTLSSLGAGAVEPGVMALMIGTSAAVREVVNEPRLHPQEQTWCYYLGQQRWVSGGATSNGGNVLKWFLEEMCEGHGSFGDLDQQAGTVAAGADGLLFLPFLAGERCPHWNHDARGVYFGMNLQTSKSHMLRAAMEGVAFQLFSIYQALIDINGVPKEIRATGGLARSTVWLQIMADVFGHDLAVPMSAEGSAFGAAAVGLIALGYEQDFSFAAKAIPVGRVVTYDAERHGLYSELFLRNRSLYHVLSDEFHEHQRIIQANGGLRR